MYEEFNFINKKNTFVFFIYGRRLITFVTSGAETAYPSGAPEFTFGF
jgi:hypothetical protein